MLHWKSRIPDHISPRVTIVNHVYIITSAYISPKKIFIVLDETIIKVELKYNLSHQILVTKHFPCKYCINVYHVATVDKHKK